MPTITAVTRQKRAKDFYNIFVDGEYMLSLSDMEVATLSIHEGQELSTEEVDELRERAGSSKSYNMALRFIEVRPRSVAEVRDYLERKGAGEIDTVIERLRANGLLDDVEFASIWIANRQALRPRSERMLVLELRRKGVAPTNIATALAAVEGDSDLDAAVAIAAKKRRLGSYDEPKKLGAYLARQGFSYEVIKKALARLDESDD